MIQVFSSRPHYQSGLSSSYWEYAAGVEAYYALMPAAELVESPELVTCPI